MAGIVDHVAKRVKLNEKSRKLPFMATVLLPENPVPMPYPNNSTGVGIVTQKYTADIVTDANGDNRFISNSLMGSMYRTVDPTTGNHVGFQSPDQTVIDSNRHLLRLLHHSCKFTYFSVADNSRGIIAVCCESDDPAFATWNESAATLGQRVGAVTLPLSDGFYAWNSLAASWSLVTQGQQTWSSAVTNLRFPYIKVSISKAAPSTHIGRVEITSSYELTSKGQLWEHKFYNRSASDLFEVFDLVNRLSIPHVFSGNTYRRDIEEILDEVDRDCKRGEIEALRVVPKDELQTKLFQLLVHAVV